MQAASCPPGVLRLLAREPSGVASWLSGLPCRALGGTGVHVLLIPKWGASPRPVYSTGGLVLKLRPLASKPVSTDPLSCLGWSCGLSTFSLLPALPGSAAWDTWGHMEARKEEQQYFFLPVHLSGPFQVAIAVSLRLSLAFLDSASCGLREGNTRQPVAPLEALGPCSAPCC